MKKLIILLLLSIISCDYKWLPSVTGYSESDSNNGYAGILGRNIVGIKINGYSFRVHLYGKSSWEKETSAGGTGGDLSTPIDGIAIRGTTYKVYTGRWLPAVSQYNINDSINGFAGILGSPISGLMVKGTTYSVAISNGSGPNKYQNFVSYGTGLEGVSYQRNLPGMREGCYFMAICVIGGLGNDSQILMARSWAVKNGFIRDSDTYVYYGWQTLASKISQQFGTYLHSDLSPKKGCNHYWVVDSSGREVFNSAGLGYSGC